MKALLVAMLLTGSALGQSKYVDVGSIGDLAYHNECLGISYRLPAGWMFGKPTDNGQALRVDDRRLLLLDVHRDPPAHFEGVQITTLDAPTPSLSVQEYVQQAAQAYVNGDPSRRQVLREAHPVNIGSRTFYLAELKSPAYHAMLATYHRGYFVVLFVSGETPEHLADATKALEGLSLSEDRRDTACSLNPNAPKTAVGVIGSLPPSPTTPSTVVRVSAAVSDGLALEKSSPVYPPEAKAQHVQGEVVLHARIGNDGLVEDLSVVSGDPLLAPAAMEAVRHWKYKPYTLNGVAVKVDTIVKVNFVLSLN